MSHPLMVQYTRQQLARQHVELLRVQEIHGVYDLRLVQDRESAMRTSERRETLKALSADLPNIRAAWRWAIENERVDEIAASSLALGNLFESSIPEGAAFFAQAVASLDEDNPAHRAALGYALVQQAEYSQWLARDGGDAPSAVERALTLLTPLGEPRGFMRARAMFAACMWGAPGRSSEVDKVLEEGLELAREHGARREIGEFLCKSVLMDNSTDPTRVQQLIEDSMVEIQRMGDLVHVAFIQQQLGVHLVQHGSPHEGFGLLLESLQLARDLDFSRFEPFILDDLAMAAYTLRDDQRAEALSLEHLASAERLRMENATRDAWWILGRVAADRGDYASARKYLVLGLRNALPLESMKHTLLALLPFVHLAVASGQIARAAELLGTVRSRWLQLSENDVFARQRPRFGAELDELRETLGSLMNGGELDSKLELGSATSLDDAVAAILRE